MLFSVIVLLAFLAVVSAMAKPAPKSTEPKVVTLKKAIETNKVGFSEALPFTSAPANSDLYDLVGYAGFDPFGFSNRLPAASLFGAGGLKWYQEAEITHGRVAQLAVVGSFFPAYYHFPGNPSIGVPENAYAELDYIKALYTVPSDAISQIVLAASAIECLRVSRTIIGDKPAGDLGLGQGGWNPFGFDYSEVEYKEKQLQELKHGRLAMLGAIGILLQYANTGIPISEQLGGSFSWPSAREIMAGPGVLGDYFPPGL